MIISRLGKARRKHAYLYVITLSFYILRGVRDHSCNSDEHYMYISTVQMRLTATVQTDISATGFVPKGFWNFCKGMIQPIDDSNSPALKTLEKLVINNLWMVIEARAVLPGFELTVPPVLLVLRQAIHPRPVNNSPIH